MWSYLRDSFVSSLALANLFPTLDFITTPSLFNASEATIDSVHDALFSGTISCRDIVSAHLLQIESYNPSINAVLSLSPHALSTADKIDATLRAGNASGPLLCVPILLKDNFDAMGMNTTGGCRALANIEPQTDAPIVRALKDAGSVILGKTNMHELALEGLSVSSLGGQTLNPYDRTRTPGGSSGGSSAAIAASFAVLGTGTDTMNSLRNPASANSLFSIRPTRGLISRTGVIPVSYTQDSIGPIARSIKDLAVALSVMSDVRYDPADNITALSPPSALRSNYVSAIDNRRGLSGLRIGLLEGFLNRTSSTETTPVNEAVDAMTSKLKLAGATILPITDPIYDSRTILSAHDMQAYEFQESINSYLQAYNTSLSSIYDGASNRDGEGSFLVIPNQYSLINTALRSSTGNATYATRHLRIQNLTLSLKRTFASNLLDAIIYPQQQNLVVKLSSPSQSGRNGILAAVTGSPVVTIPVGFSPPSEDAPIGVPIGMEILGREWDEEGLLGIAASIEDIMGRVRQPPLLKGLEKKANRKWGRQYMSVPKVEPDIEGISGVYPIGRLN